MVQKGTPIQGDVENLHMVTDIITIPQAANTNLAAGVFGYQNGASGFTIAPTDDSVEARKLRFSRFASNNSTITGFQAGALGDLAIDTIKTGAIVVAKCDGPITVNAYVRNSTVTGGNVMVLNNPIASPTGSVTSQNIADLDSWIKLRLGIYLGHVGETSDASGSGNPPTDAVDQDLVRVQLL